LRRPERSLQSNVQEALIENVSSLLMGNAPDSSPGKEKTSSIAGKSEINSYLFSDTFPLSSKTIYQAYPLFSIPVIIYGIRT
jgi:hypothetical protein